MESNAAEIRHVDRLGDRLGDAIAIATPPDTALALARSAERIRRILIVTDAWHPQVNGVVRTMERVSENLPALGAEAVFLTPAGFRSVPMPTYPDIRLALTTSGQIRKRIEAADADHVHIVTEGP